MVLILYIVINVLAFLLFIKKKKMLHILEIIVYWTVASYVYQNFSALCYMNFKTLVVTEKLNYELSHVLNRIVLFPLFMLIFLDYYLILTTFSKKLILITLFVFLLTGMEYVADFLNVLNHAHWKVWWSFAFWITALVVLLICMKVFRRILYKGGYY